MSGPQEGRAAGAVAAEGRVPGLPERSARLLSPCLLPALQLLLWHSALWMVQEATHLGPASSLPQSFLLKCLEQVRKIQADGTELQERLVSEGNLRRGGEGIEMLQQGAGRKEVAQGRAEGRERSRGKQREPWGRRQQEGTWDGRGETQGKWEKIKRGRALGGWWGSGGRTPTGQCWEGLAGGLDGGTGLRSLSGRGGKERCGCGEMGALGKEEPPGSASAPHSASFPSPVHHPQAVPP